MHKGFYGWSLESSGSGTVETKYIAEYVDNAKTWERICYIDEHYSEIEPHQESWELYSTVEFDNVTEALNWYMARYVSGKCYYIKMLEQVFVNGNMVLEQDIEPESTIMDSMKTIVNFEMKKQLRETEMKLLELQEKNTLYKEFLSKYGAEKTFEKFAEDHREDK